ncbi:hypothetical protein IWQ60_004900 [Tieghemiomyces parasiticus]|uniref:Uncharacterized protein n=1 Tax=Tieghemiomyces parasiticus TaxID=78921 RepID=A0A9W8ADE2_9FUNG|nr:hypothetical protein IWQ60_004900 [Tieghemiomyces parasiticus]
MSALTRLRKLLVVGLVILGCTYARPTSIEDPLSRPSSGRSSSYERHLQVIPHAIDQLTTDPALTAAPSALATVPYARFNSFMDTFDEFDSQAQASQFEELVRALPTNRLLEKASDEKTSGVTQIVETIMRFLEERYDRVKTGETLLQMDTQDIVQGSSPSSLPADDFSATSPTSYFLQTTALSTSSVDKTAQTSPFTYGPSPSVDGLLSDPDHLAYLDAHHKPLTLTLQNTRRLRAYKTSLNFFLYSNMVELLRKRFNTEFCLRLVIAHDEANFRQELAQADCAAPARWFPAVTSPHADNVDNPNLPGTTTQSPVATWNQLETPLDANHQAWLTFVNFNYAIHRIWHQVWAQHLKFVARLDDGPFAPYRDAVLQPFLENASASS